MSGTIVFMTATPQSPATQNKDDDSSRKRPKLTLDAGVASVLATAILVSGGLLGHLINNKGTASPSPAVTITASPAPLRVGGLKFALPAHSQVPTCQIYYGTGEIPAGHVLLIFDTPALPNGNPTASAYYSFDQEVTASPGGRWQTEPLQIGPPRVAHFSVSIIGVVSDSAQYRLLSSIRTKGHAPWVTTQLPSGPKIALAVVTNGRQGLACH